MVETAISEGELAELEVKGAMLSAMSLLEAGLRDFSKRDLLPSAEVLDLLLDTHSELAVVADPEAFDSPS